MPSKHRPEGCLCHFIYWPREGTRIPMDDCPVHRPASSVSENKDRQR